MRRTHFDRKAAERVAKRTEERSEATGRKARFREFAEEHAITFNEWADRAGISRTLFRKVCAGSDPYVRTIRAVVRAARELSGVAVRARDFFETGEDTAVAGITIPPRVIPESRTRALKKFRTNLDRILRREQIMPIDFASHVGIRRQSLLRLRTGEDEPSLSTLAAMIRTLRAMTGKAYRVGHLYDCGETDSPAGRMFSDADKRQ